MPKSSPPARPLCVLNLKANTLEWKLRRWRLMALLAAAL